jgi:hypothetical protein
MTLDAEFAQYQGQPVLVPGADPSDRGQCAQWADYVLHDVYTQPYVWLNAIDWWRQFGSTPQLVNNFVQLTDGTIKKGDFVIFNSLVGSVYGHIDVAMQDGSYNQFLGSDTNWAGNLTVHQVNHVGSQYIQGVLRLKGGTQMFNDGDAGNFNTYFFGKDQGLFRDQVGKDWKTAAYGVMEYMQTNQNLLFNDGDRGNINSALYGKDEGRFTKSVGEGWKQGVYDILQDQGFQTDALINQGDVGNLQSILKTTVPNTVVGKTWKDFVYSDLAGLLTTVGVDKDSVIQYIQGHLT